MKIHNLIQGSHEWLSYRAWHFNASDAPAMMGCSPYKTRAQLLREMHTGIAPDVDVATQKRFDNGHRAEALARPLAEEFIGEELYPVTGSLGKLSASFDGLTLDERQGFEHKALNEALRAAFAAMANKHGAGNVDAFLLPIYHRVQMEQQLHVSGAERILFMASEWTADGELVEEQHCWYYPDHDLRANIIDGWAQFERDLAAYVPTEAATPAVAEHMESLPAVSVRLDGALSVAGNLPTFTEALRGFIARMPAKPATDDDFATLDASCKALKKAEEALDAAEAGALASITDVEAMRRAVADARKLARDTRLAAEKMVDRRKVEIKEQAVLAARAALDAHVAALQAELAPMRLQPVPADFAGAIRGLRSIASMQDALDTTLAQAKIAADGQARLVRANVAAFKDRTGDQQALQALFADLATLVHKPHDDFTTVVDARIAKHQADEAAREARRQAEEAARIAAAEQRAREEEQARQAREQQQREAAERAAAAALAQAAAPAPVAVAAAPAPTPAPAPAVVHHLPLPPVAAEEPAALRLGTICERLGITMTAAFVADTLGIKPAKIEGAAKLYREGDFARICHALQQHIGQVYAAQREKVVA